MTKDERFQERHDNIAMLSELSEISHNYDALSGDCNRKAGEIARLNREINRPYVPRFKPLFLILIALVTLLIGLVVCLIIMFIDKKKWKARIEELKAALAAAEEAYAAACAARDAYDEEVFKPYLATILPDKFAMKYARNTYAIDTMLDALMNLCADTIREAILYFEEAAYRARMEGEMRSISASSADAARSAARSAAANESAAASAAATAASAAATAASMASVASSQRRMATEMERTGSYIRSHD